MKLNKKLIITTTAAILALGVSVPVIEYSTTSALAASSTNTMQLAHGAYVYNKNGKILKKYCGSRYKTHLRKGANVQCAGTVEPIDRDSKQYYLLDNDNYNQSWLPYREVKGKYYYSIGHGGYINAANVNEINGQPLYVATATVVLKTTGFPGGYIGSGKDRILIKHGQKLKVDRITTVPAGNSTSEDYRIAGTTDAFFYIGNVKVKPRQKLATYTMYTYVGLTQLSPAYSISSILQSATANKNVTIAKDESVPVIQKLYIWAPKDNKAELFYRLNYSSPTDSANFENAINNQLFYIKAADTTYLSGPQLTPTNTPEEAQADAKIATLTDKQDLQKLIDQEGTVSSSSNYKNEFLNIYKASYDEALKQAKTVNSSTSASIAEVKEAAWYLTREQQALLNATGQQNNNIEDTMPVR